MQAVQKLFKDSILIRSTAIVFVSSTLVNILNYIFTIFVARNLSVENYGEVAALFSLLLIFSVPATALATHTIREVADKSRDAELLRNFQKSNLQEILVMAVSLWVVFLVFVPVIASALDIHVAYLLIFSLFLPLNLFTSYHTAFFQGKHNFLASSAIGFFSTVLKLVFAAIFIYFGFSVGGVLFALVLSFFASLFIYREAFVNFTFSINFVNIYNKIIHVLKNQIVTTYFFAAFFLAVVSNIDVILAKYFLDSFSAGAYGALSTLGKIVLFATGAFVTVMLPLVAKGRDTGIFYKTFFGLFVSGVLVVTVFYLFAPQLVHILFGQKYDTIVPYVATMSLAVFFISLSTALVNYFLAVKNTSFLYFLAAGIFAECLFLWYNHTTINGFVNGVLYASILLLVLLLINFLTHKPVANIYEENLSNNSSL